MTVRMMRRVMEQETGGGREGEGEIHPCYSQGHGRTPIPQLDAPPDCDVLPHTRRYTPFREARLTMDATRCNRIVERLNAGLPDRHGAAEMTHRGLSSE